jgi:uncharacterized protein with GYD domain
MTMFIMLTRLNEGSASSPQDLEALEKNVMGRINAQCPDVEWISSFAALGPYDYLDIFRADGVDTATKVSALMRTFGHAHTEVWPATEWPRFKELMRRLPAEA